jgi:hypothetical protein
LRRSRIQINKPNADGRYGATFTYGVFHSFNKPPSTAFNPLLGVSGGTVEGYGSVDGSHDVDRSAAGAGAPVAAPFVNHSSVYAPIRAAL